MENDAPEVALDSLTTENVILALQSKKDVASLLSSPESPSKICSCMESLRPFGDETSSTHESSAQCELAMSRLEALFQIDSSSASSAGYADFAMIDSEEQHCTWVVAAVCAALPLLRDILPRDHGGICVVPHQHPLKKVELSQDYMRYGGTGVPFYLTNRVCDNCDSRITEKEYWCCGEPKASGGNCSVDFCSDCYDELQALFQSSSIEKAMWVVRFINAVARYVLVHMPSSARRFLVRQLAFEFPLAMFQSLVHVVVDVTDASVVHIEDNIGSIAEFEEFWHTLGLLDLLYVANTLPTTERRVGQLFSEGARLPSERFVLQGVDKCEVFSDWKRWRATFDTNAEEQSNALLGSPFKVDAHFTCFLSHSNFVPRAFLRTAVQFDTQNVEEQVLRKLVFPRELEALRQDIVLHLGYCFEAKQRVRLCDLKGAPELNGKEGELEAFDKQKSRWNVKLLGEEKASKLLKPSNLVHTDEEALRSTLKKFVDARFEGEDGSGPGVVQEFFLLALQSLISCTDFWEYNEEVRTYWFSDSQSPEAIAACRALGLILGNVIRADILLPSVFPDPLYSLLLRCLGSCTVGKWTLADLRKVNPHFARSFEQLLEYDKDDVASLFTLEWPRGDELATLPRDARGGYVQAYIEWFFDERFKAQVDAMCQGFRGVVGHSKMLRDLVSVERFAQILNGIEEPVDMAAIRRKASEVGWSSEEDKRYLEQFWDIVTSFDNEQRRKFAVFVSSSARSPLKGWSDFGLQVQKNGTGDERLPTAYTCFHLLLLPMYTSPALLRTRLLHAIDETQGFGLA